MTMLEKEFDKKIFRIEKPSTDFNSQVASKAAGNALFYLKSQLGWKASEIALVLHLHTNTINNWLGNRSVPIKSSRLSPDIQALIHLLSIHRSLLAMFENPAQQIAWLETRHPVLKYPPLTLMSKSIDGLIYVRQYLDFIRGRGA